MRLFTPLKRSEKRKGVAIAETAVVLPVFFLMLFAFIEFGHAFMTIHALNSAARRAARLGVSETATTADVRTLAQQIVGSAITTASVTILVKDASVFDDQEADPSTINYASLPDIELEDAERRQLFLVRISVNYSNIGVMGPRWLGGLTIYGQAVMRRE